MLPVEHSWSLLPNEVKAEVVRHLDLASALAMMRCGGNEEAVVREFGYFDIGITVNSLDPRTMLIQLKNKPENIVVQYWEVRAEGKGSIIKQYDGSLKLIYHCYHEIPMAEMTFSIVGRLMSESIFEVVRLEFALNFYRGLVNLKLKEVIDVKYLVITNCSRNTTKSLLDNELIETDSWIVSSNCMENLRWSEQRLIKMCKEKKLENMVLGRPCPTTFFICPSDTGDCSFEGLEHSHFMGNGFSSCGN